MRLMEVLLHGSPQLNGWSCADIHQAIVTTFGLQITAYTLNQLRYDLRKMKAHGLLVRIGKSYRYRLRIPRDGDQRSELMSITIPK